MGYKNISKDKVLVNYVPKLDYEIIREHGLDFMKVLNRELTKEKEICSFSSSSVAISAAITAYARIHMHKLKLDILGLGAQLYYSDTDSIVTNIALPDKLVNSKKLGLLKLEHILKEGIFISNKLYLVKVIYSVNNKEKLHVKAKGLKSSSLSEIDFRNLLAGFDVDNGIKTFSKTHWEQGYVEIIDKEKIRISSDSFTKREKVFNLSKSWIDTKPLFINYLDKYVVIYKNMTTFLSIPFIIIGLVSIHLSSRL